MRVILNNYFIVFYCKYPHTPTKMLPYSHTKRSTWSPSMTIDNVSHNLVNIPYNATHPLSRNDDDLTKNFFFLRETVLVSMIN